MSEDKGNKKSIIPTIVVIFVGFIVIGLWLLAFNELWFFDWRKFSDYQESLTSLFAGLALVFVAWTAFMQREELNKTSKALEDQADTMALQQFETTFFNLLNQLLNIKNNVKYGKINDIQHTPVRNSRGSDDIVPISKTLGYYQGVEAFEYANSDLKFRLKKNQILPNALLNNFYDEIRPYFGHYFRLSFNIIKFVEDNFGKKTKLSKKYIGLYQATLSSSEIALIAYNCLTPRGNKFLNYVVNYDLLDKNKNDVLLSPNHLEYFNSPPDTTSHPSQ